MKLEGEWEGFERVLDEVAAEIEETLEDDDGEPSVE